MKGFGKLTLFALAMVLSMGLALPLSATAKMVKKVDNVLVLVDTSGSMSETYADSSQKKIDAAVDMVSRLDNEVPELGYITGVYTVAPFEEVSPLQTYKKRASQLSSRRSGYGLRTAWPLILHWKRPEWSRGKNRNRTGIGWRKSTARWENRHYSFH